MRFLVVCGLLATMDILSPIIALKKVDFPTLGRPRMAMKPDLYTNVLHCFSNTRNVDRIIPSGFGGQGYISRRDMVIGVYNDMRFRVKFFYCFNISAAQAMKIGKIMFGDAESKFTDIRGHVFQQLPDGCIKNSRINQAAEGRVQRTCQNSPFLTCLLYTSPSPRDS